MPSRSQRAKHRRVAVAQRAPQHLVGEAVDLEEEDARDVVDAIGPRRRTCRRTTLRYQDSSSSIASSAEAVVVMMVNPAATRTPANQPSMVAPGLMAAAIATSPPLSTSGGASERDHAERKRQAAERRPHQRVERGGDDRGDERPGRAVDVEVRQQRAKDDQGGPVQGQDDQAADGESPVPGHAPSVTRVRVTQPHPLRVTTAHPSGA